MAKNDCVLDDEKHLSNKLDEKFRELLKDMEREFNESKKE